MPWRTAQTSTLPNSRPATRRESPQNLLPPRLLAAAEERPAALIATRDRGATALPGKVSVAITRTAERMREELERLCHTNNPVQAAGVRATIRELLKGGVIVLCPVLDGSRLEGKWR